MMRHFLTLTDVSEQELKALLQSAITLKRRRRHSRGLAGKVVAIALQKPSMRTRVSFEAGAHQLGAAVVNLGTDALHLGQREPMKDVARVLSRYVDLIVIRTFAHENLEEFAAYATIPVINGLSDLLHPCQVLADLLTLQEQFKRLKGLRLAYVGDGNNVLHSLLDACGMTGMHLVMTTPKAYQPNREIWQQASKKAARHGASIDWEPDPRKAVRGADALYTDVWVSMGQEEQRQERLKEFQAYQINSELLKLAKPGCRVMHCLPAHRGEEITDEVMESPQSVVFDQAENRLHAQKALMLFLFNQTKRTTHKTVRRRS